MAGRSPERRYGQRPGCVGVDPWTNRATTAVELVGTSNRSECTRGSEIRGAYLAVSHTARGDGETDSAMRTYVPQPSAIAPARYHASYCALRAEARFAGYAKHGECARHRRPCPPARCPGDSTADHAALGVTECHQARAKPGLNRDCSLRFSLIAKGIP